MSPLPSDVGGGSSLWRLNAALCDSPGGKRRIVLYESQTFAQHAADRINKAVTSTISIRTSRRSLCTSGSNVWEGS